MACGVLCIVRCVLCVLRCLLFVACCMFVVCCVLSVAVLCGVGVPFVALVFVVD